MGWKRYAKLGIIIKEISGLEVVAVPGRDRVIYHIDCDAYFASVEELFHPEYKKVPMAVCGDPKNRRGIILAKNQLAKGFGVKTAETIWSARQKCPNLTLAPPRRHEYAKYCEIVNAIHGQYTDMVERGGIDESYLDVTGSLHLFGGDLLKLAHEIRERVFRETSLTVSVGISFNKIFAKLASDIKKPNAVSLVSRENYKSVVWPMPVSALMMVGKKTEENLRRMNIQTIGELAGADADMLDRRLGKLGEQLRLYANGLDDSPVLQSDDVSSVGNGMTFRRNLTTRDDIVTAVNFLADEVARRMRRQGVKCMTVQVTIKDANLKSITRQKAPEVPTWLAADLARESLKLIESSWEPGEPIRLLAITAQKLVPASDAAEQTSLFGGTDEGRERRERLEKAMDKVRDKYGSRSISSGAVVKNDLGIGGGHSDDE
jgi:DNA polymerase-4